MMRAASSAPAPEPPSAAGTVSASNPASDNSLKFSNRKLASRSCCDARAANSDASSLAQLKKAGVESTESSLRMELLTMSRPIQAAPEYRGEALLIWDRPGAEGRVDRLLCRP